MRIISQDGCYDMPYEEVALKRNGCNICALNQYLSSGFVIELAKYSTKEKAIKAMEMCRNEYGKYYSVSGGSNAFTGVTIQPGVFMYPKVFQFPADDEI